MCVYWFSSLLLRLSYDVFYSFANVVIWLSVLIVYFMNVLRFLTCHMLLYVFCLCFFCVDCFYGFRIFVYRVRVFFCVSPMMFNLLSHLVFYMVVFCDSHVFFYGVSMVVHMLFYGVIAILSCVLLMVVLVCSFCV